MADKKTRADNIHDQMPALFNTRENVNWKAIIDSLGDVDQDTLDLIESVRQQFFVKTASRPYLDRLGTANLVQRPRFVGMDDPTFRDFIPIMSYQPKQVKIIMDKLLDLFFFKESTTSFISSGQVAPFDLSDEWELEYVVDDFVDERIEFRAEEFTDINNATADEVVAAINRQSTNSYAIAFEDSITKLINIRIFTKTIGAKGSVEITGGRANIGLQFDGFNTEAGIGTQNIGFNYVLNPTAEVDTSDTSSIGGPGSVVVTRQTSNPIDGIASFDCVYGSGSLLEDWCDFHLDITNLPVSENNLIIQFNYSTQSTVTTGNFEVGLWNETDSVFQYLGELPATGNFLTTSTFNATAIGIDNTKTYHIRLRTKANFGTVRTVRMDSVTANKGSFLIGYAGTEWSISTVGDTVTMTYTGTGTNPSIDRLQVGDTVIITRSGNEGSFILTSVDPANDEIQFINLFATDETFIQTTVDDVKFLTPFEANVYLRDRRAIVWEIKPGEIIVEMPPTPPVVQRRRIGSAHINGVDSLVIDTPTTDSLELANIDKFPADGGRFFFIPMNEIQTFHPVDSVTATHQFNSKLSSCLPVYTYAGISGDVLTGISPSLPTAANTIPIFLVSANRDANNIITVTTSTAHDYKVGDFIIIEDAVLGAGTGLDVNGAWQITTINSTTDFEAYSFSGPAGTKASTGGTVRIERIGTASAGSRVILTSAQIEEGLEGPFLWDENSDFVLSSLTTNLTTEIEAGTTQRNIQVDPNEIPNESGRLIFDFGTEKQEGPVRYFFKPNDGSLALDPSYVFKFTHDVGSSVAMIRRRGGIEFDGVGGEYGGYITDPAAAREVLQELMEEVKSVGIFINFIVRYPDQFYSTIDVYRSGVDPG